MISVQQVVKLLNKGNVSIPLLLLEQYKSLQLKDSEMMLIFHLHSFIMEGNSFPSFDQLLERMSCSQNELSSMLNRLLKEGFLELSQSKNHEGIMEETFSLDPLWTKLIEKVALEAERDGQVSIHPAAWPTDIEQGELQAKENLEGEIFKRFEQEFGRPLSPIECETISHWIDTDHYEPRIIFLALKEAVISSKLSLRYIDRILFEWQKNGLKSPEEIREHSKKFRQTQIKPNETKKTTTEFSFYNWLEK